MNLLSASRTTCDLLHHYGDPFDRPMTAQAWRQILRVSGSDPVFERYGLRRIGCGREKRIHFECVVC